MDFYQFYLFQIFPRTPCKMNATRLLQIFRLQSFLPFLIMHRFVDFFFLFFFIFSQNLWRILFFPV